MALISSVVRHNQGIQGNHANQGSDNRHRFGNLRQRRDSIVYLNMCITDYSHLKILNPSRGSLVIRNDSHGFTPMAIHFLKRDFCIRLAYYLYKYLLISQLFPHKKSSYN